MAHRAASQATIDRPPAVIAIERLGRLIQVGTPAPRVARAVCGIMSDWRAAAGFEAAREWAMVLHADLVAGASEVAEQAGNVDRTDVGEARQADAALVAILAARDAVAAEIRRA